MVLRLSKNSNIKTLFFSKIAFYDVKMHIFAGKGFQNDENEPSLVCQVSGVSDRSQDGSHNDPKMVPSWIQNGPKLDPKWLSKLCLR